jgi:hypothetical protein
LGFFNLRHVGVFDDNMNTVFVFWSDRDIMNPATIEVQPL